MPWKTQLLTALLPNSILLLGYPPQSTLGGSSHLLTHSNGSGILLFKWSRQKSSSPWASQMLSSQDKPVISDQTSSAVMILDCPHLMSDSIFWSSHQQGIKLHYKISLAHWYSLILTGLENLVMEELSKIFSEFLMNTSITFISFRKCGLMMQGTRNLCQRTLFSPGFKIVISCNRCRDTVSIMKEEFGGRDYWSILLPKGRTGHIVSFLTGTHLTCSE